jgi:tripartite-type tricarboxylate transporter receptor subunit TctC
VKTAKDLVALARAQPGKLYFGSAGVGNATHLTGAFFMSSARIDLTHVPYKGAGPALTDLLGGHIQILFPSISQVHRTSPRAACARSRSQARSRAALSEHPDLRRIRLPRVDMPGWQAMWFPAGTPRERIVRIQQEVAKILRTPEIRKVFDDAGLRPIGSTPEEFAAFIEKDLAFFARPEGREDRTSMREGRRSPSASGLAVHEQRETFHGFPP